MVFSCIIGDTLRIKQNGKKVHMRDFIKYISSRVMVKKKLTDILVV